MRFQPLLDESMHWQLVSTLLASLASGGVASANQSLITSRDFTISGAPCLSPCHGECNVLMPLEYPAAAGCFDNRPSWLQTAPVPTTQHFKVQNVQHGSYLSGVVSLGSGSMVGISKDGRGSWWRAEPVVQQGAHANLKHLFTLSTSASASGATQLAFSIFLTCDSSGRLEGEIAPTALHVMKDINARLQWQAVPGTENGTFKLRSNWSGSELTLNGSVLTCVPHPGGDLWRFLALSNSKDSHLKRLLGVDSEMCAPNDAAVGTTVQNQMCVGGDAWGNSCQFWATQWPTLGPFPWMLSHRWLLRWSVKEEQTQWQFHGTEVSKEQENKFHVKPFFAVPHGRSAWCFTKNGGWDFCIPPHVELYPGWSPTCAGGKPCLPWPTEGKWSHLWHSQPRNYSGCARPANAVRGWRTEATSQTDTRPFCLCEEGPRHCEDTCSGHPCPFAAGCVAGKCVGPCAKGFGGVECSKKLHGELTCHEKQALGMDDDALDFFVTLFYYPKFLAVLLLLFVAPFLMDCYQSGGFEKARSLGESSMYLHQVCPWCLAIPCCIPSVNFGLSKALYSLGVCSCQTLSAVLGVLVCATVVFGAAVVGPILVYLKVKNMDRAIAFCFAGTGFTYIMLSAAAPLLLLAYIFYKTATPLQMKLQTTRVWQSVKQSRGNISLKIVQAAIACGTDLFAFITLSPAAASLSFDAAPCLTLGRLTLFIFVVSCACLISTFVCALLTKRVPLEILDQAELRGSPVGKAAVIILLVNSIGNDLPSLFVPIMSGCLGSAEAAISEFSIYSFVYSFGSWGYTLITLCTPPSQKAYTEVPEEPKNDDVLVHLSPHDIVDTAIEQAGPEDVVTTASAPELEDTSKAGQTDDEEEPSWTDETGMREARTWLWLELVLVWVGSGASFAMAYFNSICTPDANTYTPAWASMICCVILLFVMMNIDRKCLVQAMNPESQAAIKWSLGFHIANAGPRSAQFLERADMVTDAIFAGAMLQNLHCLGQRISDIWFITMKQSTVNEVKTGTTISYNFMIVSLTAFLLPMVVQLLFVVLVCLPRYQSARLSVKEDQHKFEFYNLLGFEMTSSAILACLGQACGASLVIELAAHGEWEIIKKKSDSDPKSCLSLLVVFLWRQIQVLVAVVLLENTFQLNTQLSVLGIKRFIDGGAFLHSTVVLNLSVGLFSCVSKLLQLFINAARMYNVARAAIARDSPHYGHFWIVSCLWWIAFLICLGGLVYGICKMVAVFACQDSMWNINGCVDLSTAAVASGTWVELSQHKT